MKMVWGLCIILYLALASCAPAAQRVPFGVVGDEPRISIFGDDEKLKVAVYCDERPIGRIGKDGFISWNETPGRKTISIEPCATLVGEDKKTITDTIYITAKPKGEYHYFVERTTKRVEVISPWYTFLFLLGGRDSRDHITKDIKVIDTIDCRRISKSRAEELRSEMKPPSVSSSRSKREKKGEE